MPTNLELKAHTKSPRIAERIARSLRARRIGILRQQDVYYRVPKGRVKLRLTHGARAELIVYRRTNVRSARYSDYLVLPTSSPQIVHSLNKTLFGVLVEVRKSRLLYLYKNARIHIDTVAGLGSFLEFEVIVGKSVAQARALMKQLKHAFEIRKENIVGGSYSDLLLKNKSTRNG
jgi:predicted adenylyl cyclase CyaB